MLWKCDVTTTRNPMPASLHVCKIMNPKMFGSVVLFLFVLTSTSSAKAQPPDDMSCAEMGGAIKAISAFLDGVYMGLEGEAADPGAQRVLHALTHGLLSIQREYNESC